MVDTGLYNVQSTLFGWLYAQLLTYKPSSITTVVLKPEWPEEAITPPMWSIVMLDASEDERGYQGGAVSGGAYGNMRYGIAQVDCWVSRSNANWVQQAAQMRDAVSRAVNVLRASGSALIIKDFDTSATTPGNTSYRLTIERMESGNAPIDPNPDIERKRILLFFHWVERA